MDSQFRPGVATSEYPPATFLLTRKTFRPFNILVGDDPSQVRLAEQLLGMPCRAEEHVDDSMLLTGQPCLLCVTTGRVVDISQAVKDKTSFWTIGPIKRGSAAALAIVKHAASLLGREVGKEDARLMADELASEGIGDIRVAIWRAAWMLLGPVPEERKRWPEPWEHSTKWLPPGVDPAYRLHTLFRDLSAYAFLAAGEEGSVKKAGLSLSPSKLKYLSGLRLDPARAAETVREIAAWRARKDSPWACAVRVASVWRQ